jgi:hypothetical protein
MNWQNASTSMPILTCYHSEIINRHFGFVEDASDCFGKPIARSNREKSYGYCFSK